MGDRGLPTFLEKITSEHRSLHQGPPQRLRGAVLWHRYTLRKAWTWAVTNNANDLWDPGVTPWPETSAFSTELPPSVS